MGMSASQVRFLSLQSRKNSIGRQLLTLSNRKMALSRDMNTVALRYNNALNQTTLKWSNDSGSTYNALSYDLMMAQPVSKEFKTESSEHIAIKKWYEKGYWTKEMVQNAVIMNRITEEEYELIVKE